jgi:hypothetical protein
MKALISAFLVLSLAGCAGGVKQLWDEPIIQHEVEVVRVPVNCGIEPQVTALRLKSYEPKVIPPLLEMGIPLENVPEWLTDDLDHGWFALSMNHWENVDINDVDKKALVIQKDALIAFYRKCVADHNAPEIPPRTVPHTE